MGKMQGNRIRLIAFAVALSVFLGLSPAWGVPVWKDNGSKPSDGGKPVDADGDGFLSNKDCNDDAPDVYPGAPEIYGDGIDQDCDGVDQTADGSGDGNADDHHNPKSNRGFTAVHSRHVDSKNLACNSCHTFDRPERGLSGGGGSD